MTYQVLLTDRATRDLDEVYQWCAERAPETAVGWYNGFLDALGSLANNPERCSMAAEASKLSVEVRQLLYGRKHSYRALFLIHEQFVVVLHIHHSARREAGVEDLF